LWLGILLGVFLFLSPRARTIPAAARRIWVIALSVSASLLVSQIPFGLIRTVQREGRLGFSLWIAVLLGLWILTALWWFLTQGRSMKDPFTADLKALHRLSWALRISYIIAIILALIMWIF